MTRWLPETSKTSAPVVEADAERIRSQTNVYIFDARPKIAAMGNKLSGKGYESSENYSNCDVSFNNIENAPTMQASYEKIGRCFVE